MEWKREELKGYLGIIPGNNQQIQDAGISFRFRAWEYSNYKLDSDLSQQTSIKSMEIIVLIINVEKNKRYN